VPPSSWCKTTTTARPLSQLLFLFSSKTSRNRSHTGFTKGSASLLSSKALSSASASAIALTFSSALGGWDWFVAAAMMLALASESWSRIGRFPNTSSMPSAIEAYSRDISAFWLVASSSGRAGWMLCWERKARNSRLRQTSGIRMMDYKSL
jgi:hypothetical protein